MLKHGASWRRTRSDRSASDTDALQFDYSVRFSGFAKRRRGDVVNGNSSGSLSIEDAVVGVAVKHRVDSKPIDRFFQPAGAKEGENFGIFPFQRGADRGVMEYYDSPFCL